MKGTIALILLCAGALVACTGQGNLTFDVKVNTPTPLAAKTATSVAVKSTATVPSANSATPAAESEEQPPSPGGQETSADKLPPEVVILIQTQLAGQTMAGAPRVFIIPQSETQVEAQYTQQLNSHGWQQVSTSTGLTGKAKVIIIQKGKMKAHVLIVSQSNAETAVYILMTRV